MRQFCGTNLRTLHLAILPSWIPSHGIQEATGYEPNYGSSACKALYLLFTTAIATSPTSSSTGSSHWHNDCPFTVFNVTGSLCNRLDSRANPLFTTCLFTLTPLLLTAVSILRLQAACIMRFHHCGHTRLGPL